MLLTFGTEGAGMLGVATQKNNGNCQVLSIFRKLLNGNQKRFFKARVPPLKIAHLPGSETCALDPYRY